MKQPAPSHPLFCAIKIGWIARCRSAAYPSGASASKNPIYTAFWCPTQTALNVGTWIAVRQRARERAFGQPRGQTPHKRKMDNKMNQLASKLTAGIIVTLLTNASGATADEQDYRYTATLNDKGKYCARVKVLDYSGQRKKTICRSLEAWQAMGYRVEKPSVAVSEDESDEKPV